VGVAVVGNLREGQGYMIDIDLYKDIYIYTYIDKYIITHIYQALEQIDHAVACAVGVAVVGHLREA